MMNEFERGMAITDEIMFGRATWERLFEAPSFFFRYDICGTIQFRNFLNNFLFSLNFPGTVTLSFSL